MSTPHSPISFGWKELDRWYYGVRYARGCHPDDLWTRYFTSSKLVKEYRETYGEPDVVEVRQTFPTDTLARAWEEIVLRRIGAVKDERWLNRCNGGREWGYFKTEQASEETKKKMRDYSFNRSEEHTRRLRKNHKGFQSLTKDELHVVLETRRNNPGWWNTEHRKKITEHNRMKAEDPEWRKRVSAGVIAHYDKIGRVPKTEKSYTESGYGQRKSDTHRKAISEGLKGIKHPTKECEHCGRIVSAANYKRWHGENCKEKNT